ncbi:DUF5808 domain-containing protein [Sanguibacter sp. 25GB23B1]|uniref:DUF5808 domain-containing protein n=1 Tax=unclassified Sanguibacter TaxID=2645534 RepID=UPI0032AF795F
MKKREDTGLRDLVKAVTLALAAAAVVRELRLPRGERSWHGRIVGVPYDLRRPTWERVRQSWWAPADPRLVTPRAFGVGWAINLGRITELARARTHREH